MCVCILMNNSTKAPFNTDNLKNMLQICTGGLYQSYLCIRPLSKPTIKQGEKFKYIKSITLIILLT